MRITFVTRKFGNVERNSHCDVLHITPIRVARLFLDCNGDFAIKAYSVKLIFTYNLVEGADTINSDNEFQTYITLLLLLSAFPIRGRHSGFSFSSWFYQLYLPPSLQP